MFLLGRIRNAIEKNTITEEPNSPEARLANLFVSTCKRRLLFDYSRGGRNVRTDSRIHQGL